MSNSTTITIDGIQQVNKLLQKLNDYPKQQKQLIQVGGRAALRPTVRAMRAAAPKSNKQPFTDRSGIRRRSGDLKRSIGTKSARKSPTVIAGPRRSKKWVGFYATMVEYGTVRRATKSGANRGSVRGINRIGNAAQRTKPTVMRIYRDKILDSFGKYAKKAGLMP